MNHSFLWLLPINIKSSSLPGSASVWLSWKIYVCIGSVPACLPIQYTGLFLIGATYLIADPFFSLFSRFLSPTRINGILLPKLFWPTMRKNCSCDQEFVLKFEAEGREFSKFLRSLEQFIQSIVASTNTCYYSENQIFYSLE